MRGAFFFGPGAARKLPTRRRARVLKRRPTSRAVRMLRLLIPTGGGYTWVEHSPPAPFPDEFLWADLFVPSPEEEKAVESLLTVDVPTREEMKEIETSN